MDFRLTTFNLLAPCYKRMHDREVAPHVAATGLLANRARTERTARESEFDGVWRERALETVSARKQEERTHLFVLCLGCPLQGSKRVSGHPCVSTVVVR